MTFIGIPDLIAHISQFNYREYYEKATLRKCPVVIDGCDLMNFLFLRCQEDAIVEDGAKDKNPRASAKKGFPNPHWFGGDWETYARNVRSFFQQLKQCEITPIVIMDGAFSRITALKEESRLISDTLESVKLEGVPGKKYTPIFLRTVFLEVVAEQNIHCFQTAMNSEYTIAFVARLFGNCFILSSKLNFLLFINNNTIRFQSLRFTKVAIEETVQEAQKSNEAEQKGGTPIARKVLTLQADYLLVHRLCDEQFQLKDRRLLPLAAVILENDYIYAKALLTFPAVSTSRHQDDTPSNRIANLMKWLGRKKSLDEAIKALLRLMSEPKRLRGDWIINKIIKMYEGVNGESGVWLAIQKKLDTSTWTTPEGLALAFNHLAVGDTVAPAPSTTSQCPKDWLPGESSELEDNDMPDLIEATTTTNSGTHYLMEEKFRQHTDSLEFKVCLKNLPQWFVDAHTNCEFHPYLLDLQKNFRMTYNPQVEWLEGENCHEVCLQVILTTATILMEGEYMLTITGRGKDRAYTKKFNLLAPTELAFIGGDLPTLYFSGSVINNQFKAELNKIFTLPGDIHYEKVPKSRKLAIIEEVLFGSNLSARVYVQSWPASYRIWIACLLYYVGSHCGSHAFEMRQVMSVACSFLFCIIKNLLVNPSEVKSKGSSGERLDNFFYARYQAAIKASPEKLKIVREFYQKHEDFSGVTGAPFKESYDIKISHIMSEYQCVVFHTEMLNTLLDKPYKSPNVRCTINNFLMYNLAHVFLHDFLPTGTALRDFTTKLYSACHVQELIPIIRDFIVVSTKMFML